jgi:hypothetical protein
MMQYPVAHITAQGARLRMRGAAPVAATQPQLIQRPAPTTIVAAITVWRRLNGQRVDAARRRRTRGMLVIVYLILLS